MMALLLVVLVACGDKDAGGNQDKDGNQEVENNGENNNKGENNTEEDPDQNDSGMPIVKEPITLKMFTGMSNTTKNNWDDILVWNHYEDMTGIHVDFEQIPGDSLEEKRNLALAGGTLPDVFFAANIPPLDLFKYGTQGTFIPLNDLIEEHAPNLMALMEQDPGIRKAMTFPDGKIYSLPYLGDPAFTSLRTNPLPFISQKALDHVGMENPETLEEYYDFLVAMKNDGPEGQRGLGVPNIDYFVDFLKGSFGVGNNGRPFIDKDPESGDVRFYQISDNYKELLEFTHKLYKEDLIEQNIFTLEWAQFLANGAEGDYGSTIFYAPSDLFGEEVGGDFIGGNVLEGPHGDKKYARYANPVFHIGKFAITSENEYPVESIKWADYFYSDEGSKLWYMGVEGETFEVDENGEYKYVDKIVNSPEGLTKEQELVKYLGWVGLGAPGIIKQEYFDGSESAPQPMAAAEDIEPFLIEEPWPAFTYTEDETKDLSSIGADIEKYATEMKDKFISGDVPFSEWDKYVSTIEGMGLDKYLEIQNNAYGRYLEN